MPSTFFVTALLSSTLAFVALASPVRAQQAGGVAASEAKFRPVRAISGTKGVAQGGRYVMQDPRTIFYIPQDRQVIVYFDWEGPVGPHKFEALWKNPEGKVSVITDFSYEAKDKRFGGYFTLLLSETVTTGLWTLEARIDGEAAGSHAFQILAGERPAGETGAPVRIALTPAQAYQQAVTGTVFLEKLSIAGERLQTGSGFFLSEDLIVTAFQVIDGASKIRVVLPDGRSLETGEVLAWHRRQDWAVLRVAGALGKPFKRATTNSWSVGDRCFSLDVPGERSRTIADVDIVGKNTYPDAGERLNLSRPFDNRSLGSPVLNEYGEVIALVGGTLLPGASSLDGTRFGYWFGLANMQGVVRGALAVPLHLVSLSSSQPARFEEMMKAGQFAPPIAGHLNVMSGSLVGGPVKKGSIPSQVDSDSEFSRKEGQVTLTVHWDPKEKRKGIAIIRLYDINYRFTGESKPSKIDLKPGEIRTTTWNIPIATFPAGVYRMDVYLDTEPAWRTFFKVTD